MVLTAQLLGVASVDGIASIRRKLSRICRCLIERYGEPSLGNQPDPLDEIAFIVLSARTTETLYMRAFKNLKRRFPRWSDLLEAAPADVQKEIAVAGLGQKRSIQLIGIYRQLCADFGANARVALNKMTAQGVFDYLTGLPGLSAKSALCVMMWSLGHDVFPADTHVARIMSRLGFISEGLRPEYAQRAVAPLIPLGACKRLHTVFVLHGRAVCKPGLPECDRCCIRRSCMWPRR